MLGIAAQTQKKTNMIQVCVACRQVKSEVSIHANTHLHSFFFYACGDAYRLRTMRI